VLFAGGELPFFHGFNSLLIEAVTETFSNVFELHRSFRSYDDEQFDRSLNTGLASVVGVFGLNLLQQGRFTDPATDVECATSNTTAFPGASAAPSSRANTLACSRANTASGARARGQWSRNSVGVSEHPIGERYDIGHLRYKNCGLHRKYRCEVLCFDHRRNDLLIGAARKLSLGWGSKRFPAATT